MARDKLCDLVAEADDDLMMKYLDGEEQLTQAELEGLFDKAIAQELFIPVFVGSTIIKQGIQGLMEDICTYFPHPTAHGPIPTADGGEVKDFQRRRACVLRVQDLGRPLCWPPELREGAFGHAGAGPRAAERAHGQKGAPGPCVRDEGQRNHAGEKRYGGRHRGGAEARRNAHGATRFRETGALPLPRCRSPFRSILSPLKL